MILQTSRIGEFIGYILRTKFNAERVGLLVFVFFSNEYATKIHSKDNAVLSRAVHEGSYRKLHPFKILTCFIYKHIQSFVTRDNDSLYCRYILGGIRLDGPHTVEYGQHACRSQRVFRPSGQWQGFTVTPPEVIVKFPLMVRILLQNTKMKSVITD